VVAATLVFIWLAHAAVVGGQVPLESSREGVVYAASYRKSAQVCDGNTHPVFIRLEPNPTRRIQVGFFESSAGAIGPQWRTAGWLAALVATTFLGRDLHAQRISYTLEGLIDGPSAGALTTSGLLALLRGERIPDNVSMTGTINPDGTVGPVGGIPQKVMGAARTAQGHLRRHDPIYLAARGALEQLGKLPDLFDPGLATSLAQLGALLLTVAHASLLVAQHYSLEARTDKLGRVVGFGREAAVLRMSELADQETLRAVGEAQAATAGASTPMLAAALDAARRNRDVSVTAQDRLTALSLYWHTTLIARLMSQLTPLR
jgi:hypothetical protein